MPIEITTWLRAYFALRERALETRGYTEFITETEEVFRDDLLADQDVTDLLCLPIYDLADRWRS